MSLIRGNALAIPLADESVDLIVTSPPYFALRSYTDGGEHYDGQIGSEATPAEFIAALVEVTRECVRVLKPSGSLWVNLGDKYSGAGPQNAPGARSSVGNSEQWQQVKHGRAKSLMGLPWRYALACIDDLGLILRAEVIWSKPNGLPESVQDRVRRSHENWFHFTKEPRYYSAVDEIREPHVRTERPWEIEGRHPDSAGARAASGQVAQGNTIRPDHDRSIAFNPLGKLPGSVWTIATEPLRVPDHIGVDHFAAFPSEWPRRIILGWSPSGVCVACGEGRRPVVEREPSDWEQRKANGEPMRHGLNGAAGAKAGGWSGVSGEITGESCACPTPDAPTRPAVVLDPFAGTGTSVAVANALGRHGVGLDLSADYLKLARWRCQDPGLRAKVLGVDKPKPQVVGQLSIL